MIAMSLWTISVFCRRERERQIKIYFDYFDVKCMYVYINIRIIKSKLPHPSQSSYVELYLKRLQLLCGPSVYACKQPGSSFDASSQLNL